MTPTPVPRSAPAPAFAAAQRPPRRGDRRGRHLLGAVAALAVTGAILAAVPWLLWTWRGNPLPDPVDPQRWIRLAADGWIHPDVIPNMIAVGVWIVWAQLLLGLALEVASRLSRGTSVRRSILVAPPVQRLAARLVAGISLLFTAAPAATAAPSLEAIAHVVTTDTSPRTESPSTESPSTEPAHRRAPERPEPSRHPRTRALLVHAGQAGPEYSVASRADSNWHPTRPDHVVVAGDTLWDIAQKRYPQATAGALPRVVAAIFHANRDTQDQHGRPLEDPDTLYPGMRLHLPAVGVAPRPSAPTLAPDTPPYGAPDSDSGDGQATGPDSGQDSGPGTGPKGDADNDGRRDHGSTLLSHLVPSRALAHPPAPDAPEDQATDPTSPSEPSPGASAPPGSAGSHDADATPEASPQPAPTGSASHPPSRVAPGAGDAARADQEQRVEDGSWVQSWIERGVLLVAGVLAVASYRRRRRDARVRPGQTIPDPDPALVPFHTAMRAAHDPDVPARIDQAVRSLAALHRRDPRTGPGAHRAVQPGAATGGAPIMQVLLVQPDGALDVLLRDPAAHLPQPWVATADRRIWRLPADTDVMLDEAAGQMPHPHPALVQLGTTTDGATLCIDLETIGVLALTQDAPETSPHTDFAQGAAGEAGVAPASMRGIARALMATLATSPLAHLPKVHTSGFDPYGFVREERVHAHAVISEALPQITADAATITASLTQQHVPHTLALRARAPHDAADPTIAIVVDRDITRGQAHDLTSTAGDGGHGVAVVLPLDAAPTTTWRLVRLTTTAAAGDHPNTRDGDITGSHLDTETAAVPDDAADTVERWRLDPLGITLTPISLAAHELTNLAALLDEAAAPAATPTDPAVILPFRRPGPSDHEPDQAGKPTQQPSWQPGRQMPPPFTPPPWRVMVRLLGPVDLVGRDSGAATGLRDRTIEAIAWLVLHPAGTRYRMETAMWPAGARTGTISNTLSRARAALEQLAGPEAHEWIPSYQAGLTIDPAVTTDLTVLQAHMDYALRHRDRPDAVIPVLREGLTLVRGAPAGWPWLDAELGSVLTTTPTTAASLLAGLCLEHGDLDGVFTATSIGLSIIPAHPELFAMRMRARAAAGDRAGVRAEYGAYLRAESDDPMADGDTDRDLERLYQHLYRATGRQPPH